ncbi:uncharacterized protein LOC113780098 [Coffea eugenioides]|uniref:uncharacterized protein LOC113780098 n=1 Tax=Coffea eugenioides TaxID=49369 RepID=UPI000F604895|nr:uncharacterized protein LOC113780098 [Coffea eugenioides]
MEEKQLEHFSHEEHPLILCELQKENDDGSIDQKPAVCYGCQEQISDSIAYCCFPCDFFLHKRCAELPPQIRHPMHSQHDLVLLRNPTYFSGGCVCNACGQYPWKFFTYHCSSCDFDLDVSCAILDQREIKLDCHDHPLVQLNRPATFYCHACHKVDEDWSYLCPTCQFWIHRKCASRLTPTVKHKDHDHSLLRAYFLPSEYLYLSFTQYCPVCRKKVHLSDWLYYCGPCRYFVHVTCVVISQEDAGEQVQNAVKLPSSNAVQGLIARFLLKEDEISNSNDSGKSNIEEEIFMDSHGKHPLVLSEKVQNLDEIKSTTSDDQEEAKALLVCDVCIEPICSSDDLHYYACVECGYFVHLTCSNLPPELHVPKHPQHPFSLRYTRNAVGLFRCGACRRATNAACYYCEPCELSICIKCASASMMTSSVKHAGHKKHLLTPFQSSNPCTACGDTYRGGFGFTCEDCHFYVCYDCALLPPTTTQRWDKHPLHLIYPPYFEHLEEFYCMLCKKEINPNHWMYHCRECDYSLHPLCVPQLGLFRCVKFGRSLSVNNHSHPLTHVAEAKYKSFCESCDNKRLDWGPAFECDFCRFYLCLKCAIERELTDDEE